MFNIPEIRDTISCPRVRCRVYDRWSDSSAANAEKKHRPRKGRTYNVDFDPRREHRGRRRGQRPNVKHSRRNMKPSVWNASKRKAKIRRIRAKQRNLKMSFHDFRAESDQEMEDHDDLEYNLWLSRMHKRQFENWTNREFRAMECAQNTLQSYSIVCTPPRVNRLMALYRKILRLQEEKREAQENDAFNRVLIKLDSKINEIEDSVDRVIVTYIREVTRGQCSCDYGTLGIMVCPNTIISF